MCGLFGAVLFNEESSERGLLERIANAKNVQLHRGPDMQDEGVYEVGAAKVLLAHQRLSILDLSDSGRQPMENSSKTTCIVFNGEIYNYQELKESHGLKGLKSETDTEVVIELLASNHISECLAEFNGMWAIACLDKVNGKLLLARDRAGVKPLYYTIVDGNLYFASEIKGVLELTGGRFELELGVIGKYIEQSLQDDTVKTFFKNIFCLPPGTYCEINLGAGCATVEPVSYWAPLGKSEKHNYENAKEHFKNLFDDAVKLRLRADVPVGLTLSGGLDSTVICSAISALAGRDFKVLSGTSLGQPGDESKFINIAARHYGIEVHKIDLSWTPAETISLMHKATWQNDAPLGSLSNVAFYLLMKEARELGVKVILSGQGADEIFCGYKKYLGFYLKRLIRNRRYFQAVRVFFSFAVRGTVLNQFSWAEARRYLNGSVNNKNSILSPKVSEALELAPLGDIGGTIQQRQWEDYSKYSIPYLTHYEDRMSMAFGREIRLPFLDYRVVEYMLNAPIELKLRFGWTKYLLRVAYEASLPGEITWRKDKQGFTNPQEGWLKRELQPYVLSYFDSSAEIFRLGLINREKLIAKYKKYCEGNGRVWYREIFNPFALEVWLREYSQYLKV